MNDPKTTIYDVATKAEVGISTVSRVLNESSHVAETTRLRVLAAIEELGFRPNGRARNLAMRNQQTVALAISTLTTPFHNELLDGVRRCARNHEIDLLLYDLDPVSSEKTLLNFLKRKAVDGLLAACPPIDGQVERRLKTLNMPIVLVGCNHPDFDCYFWDEEAGSQLAVEHLISQGHARIGMIRAETDGHVQSERAKGYRRALKQARIPYDEALVISNSMNHHEGFSEQHGYEAMQRLLHVDPPVTAVFASSDLQAIGAMQAIRDAGMTVPDDIAMIGYDDMKTSAYIGLSSINQDARRIGCDAMERLLHRVKQRSNGSPTAHKIYPTLQVRASSRHMVH